MRAQRMQAHRLRELAVAAGVDPRSVARALRGEVLRPLTLLRIEPVLRAAGLWPLSNLKEGAGGR